MLAAFLILLLGRYRKLCAHLFVTTLTAASGLALFSVLPFLSGHNRAEFRIPWPPPFNELSIGLDPLSAFFLLTIACVSLAAGVFGCGYLKEKNTKRNPNVHYFFYLLLEASLFLVVTAKNVFLFLAAWELMTFFAYFLLTFYDEKKFVREAGSLYLIATHCGTFCLMVMFILMGFAAGSMDFDRMALTHYPPVMTGVFFALGLLGFGVKAGFFPIHIWLPYAHPAAPSHISGLFSGIMIKTGIYGLLRMIFILKDIPEWCGPAMLLIGAVSGVLGVLYALGQHEIKRLLAYHSIENIGIIALGIGMGLMGNTYHQKLIALAGYGGALLHVLNHAIFKCLLFLSAGSVIRSTGTGEIDEMGGLLKYLPFTGHFFLIGSLAICGLPLLNGFISEWLVYRSFFEGILHLNKWGITLAVLSLLSLALIGGLAATCFAKAFSVIFLGHNRSHRQEAYKESPWMMTCPMAFLAALCVWIGLFPKAFVGFSLANAQFLTALELVPAETRTLLQPILSANKVLSLFLLVLGFLTLYRNFLARRHPQGLSETWSCGYAWPSPRMQYSASSFAEPVLRLFKSVVHFESCPVRSGQYLPEKLDLSSKVVDVPDRFIFRPIYVVLRKFSKLMLKVQSGHIPQYLFYIFIALVVLLLWKFPWRA